LGEEARPLVADLAGTAQFLANAGIVLTPEARNLFLDFVAQDFIEALYLLKRRAEGNYSADGHIRKFPARAVRPHKEAIRPLALWEQWVAAAQPAASTKTRWSGIFQTLDTKFPDANRISEDDARGWLREIAERGTAGTAKKNWLAAIKTIFAWAVGQKLTAANQFGAIKIKVPKKNKLREKAFTPDEAAMILRASLTSGDAAKRRIPWLQAYSGCRGGEICQLRGQDVHQIEGVWAIVLTPDAGSIKNRTARTVPLHEHLIEQGFLRFIKSKGNGALFYDAKTTPANLGHTLGQWVRRIGVTDLGVSPNHSWRHLWKQIAERSGISERVSDTITGHAPASVGRAYGKPNLSDMAAALAKFPRYLQTSEGRKMKRALGD
jgi:integrase